MHFGQHTLQLNSVPYIKKNLIRYAKNEGRRTQQTLNGCLSLKLFNMDWIGTKICQNVFILSGAVVY